MSEVQNRVIAADETDIRLDRWFRRHFPQVGHGYLEKLLRTGQVRVDGHRAKASLRLEAGQTVRVPPLVEAAVSAGPRAPAQPRVSRRDADDLLARVLYRDADVIAIDKPAGLAVQGGTGTSRHLDAMLDVLRFDAPERPRLVHRLDKDTSGVLLLARNALSATRLAEVFRGKAARKYYWAVTVGVPRPFKGRIDAALAKEAGPRGERVARDEEDGRKAASLYSVVEAAGKRAAWVALWPLTGRTHQLRVHMALIGRPILGDGKYGGAEAFIPGAELGRQLHLHAQRIVVPHPRGGGRSVDVSAPLPDHLEATWAYFGFDRRDDGDPFAGIE